MKKLLCMFLLLSACSQNESVSNITSTSELQSELGVVISPDTAEYASSGSDLTITYNVKSTSSTPQTQAVELDLGDQGLAVLTPSCANFSKSRVCTVRLKFTVGSRTNGTYSDTLKIGDLEMPLSVVLTKPSSISDADAFEITEGANLDVSAINFGAASLSSSVSKTIVIKDTTRKTSSAVPLTLGSTDFTSSVASCTSVAVNSSAGCSVRLNFSGSGKAAGNFSSTLSVAGKSIALSGVVQSGAVSSGSALIGMLESDGATVLSAKDFGTLALSSKASMVVKAKNTGTASLTGGAVSITGAGANAFYVSGSNCGSVLSVNATCQLTVNLNTSTILSGAQTATLNYGGQSVSLAINISSNVATPPVAKFLITLYLFMPQYANNSQGHYELDGEVLALGAGLTTRELAQGSHVLKFISNTPDLKLNTWFGLCAGQGATCTFTVSAPGIIYPSASATAPKYTLTLLPLEGAPESYYDEPYKTVNSYVPNEYVYVEAKFDYNKFTFSHWTGGPCDSKTFQGCGFYITGNTTIGVVLIPKPEIELNLYGQNAFAGTSMYFGGNVQLDAIPEGTALTFEMNGQALVNLPEVLVGSNGSYSVGIDLPATPQEINITVNAATGQTATLTFTTISPPLVIVDNEESLSVYLNGEDKILTGTTDLPDGATVTLQINVDSYTSIVQGGTFAITIPESAIASMSPGAWYLNLMTSVGYSKVIIMNILDDSPVVE